jgi:deoxyribodipyrimidine photo-lyase
VFTPFHRRWADLPREPWPDPGQAAVADDAGCGVPASDPAEPAGEHAALDRLAAFEDRADRYQDDRDLPATDGTSRLSEDLRFGTISPRTIEQVVGTGSDGRAGFVRQLAWREFCAQLMRAFPRLATTELRPEYRSMEWRDDPDGVAAWKDGRTGYPIVDAAMRQLSETGWMHNRVRMLTASFLVKDLLVDWRVGERHFAELLHDFDPAQNAANWQWVAGTGADAAPYFRVFNPVTQGKRFDPEGEFTRHWVPELAGLAGADIHAPWELGPLELEAAGITLGVTYPAPIVDHAEARQTAIEAYERARALEP